MNFPFNHCTLWQALKEIDAALGISPKLHGLSSSEVIPTHSALEECVDWTDMRVEGPTVPLGLFVLRFNGN